METILAVGLVLACWSTPATLYVLHKWGLIGGEPRELLRHRIELEAKKLEFETRRQAIVEEQIALQKQQFDVQAAIKREQMGMTAALQAQRQQVMNPQAGFRGNLPPVPGVGTYRGPPNGSGG